MASEALAEMEKFKLRCPTWETNPGHQQTQLMLYHWATETSNIIGSPASLFEIWGTMATVTGSLTESDKSVGIGWCLCCGLEAEQIKRISDTGWWCRLSWWLNGKSISNSRLGRLWFFPFLPNLHLQFPFPSPFHLLLALCFEISFRNEKVMALQNLVSQRFRDWAASFVGTRPWAARPCFYGHSKHQSMVRDDTRTKQASESQKNELRSCCTSQAWTDFVLLSSEHNSPCVWSNIVCIWRAFALRFSRSDLQWGDLSHINGMFIVMTGQVVAQIWSSEAVRQVSMFAWIIFCTPRVKAFINLLGQSHQWICTYCLRTQ